MLQNDNDPFVFSKSLCMHAWLMMIINCFFFHSPQDFMRATFILTYAQNEYEVFAYFLSFSCLQIGSIPVEWNFG
jgi:hypothetical protein